MTGKTMHQSQVGLRATLTTLVERWEEIADRLTARHDTAFFAEFTDLQRTEADEANTYRKAARDVRDVLRTGRIPHDLMTDAELEQYGEARS